MALAGSPIPRGLADLKVAVLTGDTPGTNIDVFGIRGLNWTVESDSDQLEGDNSVIAIVRNPKRLTGSIELGATSLTGLAVMVGGSVVAAGTDTTETNTLDESAAAGTQYFQATGTTNSQEATGTGYQVILKKLLVVSGPNESLTVNEWSTPTLDFEGIAISGTLLSRIHQETFTVAA